MKASLGRSCNGQPTLIGGKHRVGPAGFRNSMPAVMHNSRELHDAAMQRALEIAKPETMDRERELLLGLTGPPSRDELALLEAV